METTVKKLQHILDKAVDQKQIFGTAFSLKAPEITWSGTSGNFEMGEQYFIASTTKLFTTACILHFAAQNKLSLNDKITRYLPAELTAGLHVYKGKDYSNLLTIKNLLAHTSGLPDYFQQKNRGEKSLEHQLFSGQDQTWSVEEVSTFCKNNTPLFEPGRKGKAHYSDSNFQLLGKIIETISEKTLEETYQAIIFRPLQLVKTYLFSDMSDTRPKTLYYKNLPLSIPKAMSSFGPDGGIVSTSEEMLVFIEAFFSGKLFPAHYLNALKVWNPIFFPMQSGIGIHRFKLPWILSPFNPIPEFIGHSGLSGALAFYVPSKNIYIAGTVNQISNPSLSFKVSIQLVHTLAKNMPPPR
jgi:D-alanyl-D-alanine carboxypeptidase